ncbi:hypothetical protein D8770_21705 [Methylobacterium sp. DB1607]|nr:hypothetical protein [Methylobacterium sp. DB1607]
MVTFSRTSTALMCWHEVGHAWATVVVERYPILVTLCGDPPTHGFTAKYKRFSCEVATTRRHGDIQVHVEDDGRAT